jgi:hypothetical protein
VLSLASPVLAVRGKPVRRAKAPPEPWHPSGSPTPVRGFFNVTPKTISPGAKLDALQCARSGAVPGTVRLKGTERKGTPDSAPRMYTPHAGFPRSALVSDGPRKGLSSLPLSLLRSKARCAPSVVRPLAGAGIHRIPASYPARPWPWPGRARSISRPFGRVLRLRASLGLSKGV